MARDRNEEEELDEEMEDGESLPEGVKVTNVNHHKLGGLGKCVITLMCLGVLAGGICYLESDLPVHNKSVGQVLSAEASYTVLDEVIANFDGDREDGLVARLDNYETLIKISERLHEYDLASITDGLQAFEIPESINVDELEGKLDEFDAYLRRGVSNRILSKDSEAFVRLALYLAAQEKAVNLVIQGDAFQDLADLKLRALKAKVADSCNFPSEETDNMRLASYDGERMLQYTGGTGTVYYVRFGDSAFISDYMNSIFGDQAYSGEATTAYNEDLNKRFLNELDAAKTFIQMEVTVNSDGELVFAAPKSVQRITHIFRSPKNDTNIG